MAQMYADGMADKNIEDGKFESEITFQEFSQLLNLQYQAGVSFLTDQFLRNLSSWINENYFKITKNCTHD